MGSCLLKPEFSLWKEDKILTLQFVIIDRQDAKALLLCMSVCFGDNAQEEGGGLIWTEGGRNHQVLAGLQHQELHHFAGVHVGLGLGDGRIRFEEGGRKLSVVCHVLRLGRRPSAWTWLTDPLIQVCKLRVESQPVSYLISHLEGNKQRTFTLVSRSRAISLSPFDFPVVSSFITPCVSSSVLLGTSVLLLFFCHL